MIHRCGDLPTALRASIAIPGLLPPVCTEEGVLVDGGMMNNLPADIAAGMERGPVLAIDVGSDLAFQSMPVRTWRGRAVRSWLGMPAAMPAIVPLLLRAATVSSDAQTMMAIASATAILKPPLAGVDLRAWASYEAVAEIGYRCAREALGAGHLDGWCMTRGRPVPQPAAGLS
jgi:NTE family protein